MASHGIFTPNSINLFSVNSISLLILEAKLTGYAYTASLIIKSDNRSNRILNSEFLLKHITNRDLDLRIVTRNRDLFNVNKFFQT